LNAYASNTDSLKHYLGAVVNTGKDNGYSGNSALDIKDPHYGWKLGSFFVNGYTRVTEDPNHNPVIIKTLGDKVALWFNLEQDISKLNGNDKLTVSEDKNGYDKYFETAKTNFGHGTLIIRHTDWQNKPNDPTVYTDYLTASTTGANRQVELFEEGDYEVALDYEIRKDNVPFPDSYTNYRIFFKFSVRNGNCMVYPFDVTTKGELTNSSITENGFYLDLAKSRYLDIDIKKEVMADGAEGLTTDTRFNRPAKDGDQYTEDGIYTLTVSNRYTGEKTTKRIYVGTNNVLKAYVTTGLPIKEINAQLSLGAQIKNDGTIVFPPSNAEIVMSDAITREPLAGAVFTVRKEGGAYIGNEHTTGVDGKAVIPSLEPGSYIVTEVKTPENYLLNEQSQTIEVRSNEVATAYFQGTELPSLNMCSIDSQTGKFIAGTQFTVTDDAGVVVAEAESLGTGAITIEHILPGVYTIAGTNADNGYILNDDAKYTVEVRADGAVYCNGAALADSMVTFQANRLPENDESENDLSASEPATDAFAESGDNNNSYTIIWVGVIAVVVILGALIIVIQKRRSARAIAIKVKDDAMSNTNADVGGEDK
jgi:hypothetical protein